MNEGVPIRAATSDDVEAVDRVVRRAYATYTARIGREPAPILADHAAEIASGAVWVATDRDGRPQGVVVLRRTPAWLVLENLAVAPEHQRRGIGRALIAFAERRAGELGLAEVRLYTNAKMHENLQLYPRLGYEEYDRRSDEGFDRVFFRKRLM